MKFFADPASHSDLHCGLALETTLASDFVPGGWMSQQPYLSLVRPLCGFFRRTQALMSQSLSSSLSNVQSVQGSGSPLFRNPCFGLCLVGRSPHKLANGGGFHTSLAAIYNKKYILHWLSTPRDIHASMEIKMRVFRKQDSFLYQQYSVIILTFFCWVTCNLQMLPGWDMLACYPPAAPSAVLKVRFAGYGGGNNSLSSLVWTKIFRRVQISFCGDLRFLTEVVINYFLWWFPGRQAGKRARDTCVSSLCGP